MSGRERVKFQVRYLQLHNRVGGGGGAFYILPNKLSLDKVAALCLERDTLHLSVFILILRVPAPPQKNIPVAPLEIRSP